MPLFKFGETACELKLTELIASLQAILQISETRSGLEFLTAQGTIAKEAGYAERNRPGSK